MSTPHIGQTTEVNGKQYECTRLELDQSEGELIAVFTRTYNEDDKPQPIPPFRGGHTIDFVIRDETSGWTQDLQDALEQDAMIWRKDSGA